MPELLRRVRNLLSHNAPHLQWPPTTYGQNRVLRDTQHHRNLWHPVDRLSQNEDAANRFVHLQVQILHRRLATVQPTVRDLIRRSMGTGYRCFFDASLIDG
ncbi:MAG: hypothetical protein CMA60_00615 [Euryarchaeota archaeon]|nr:hypothetical protein [Euryarchaeota archaeon]